jgi:hypothetical protein
VSALALTGLTSNLSSPQPPGTTVTFSAGASGGVQPYQYKWLVLNGTTWTMAKDWSTSSTFAWTPTVADASYRVGVWARSGPSTADAADNPLSAQDVAFPIVQLVQPLALTNLFSNLSSPQFLGASVKFTASVSGGTSPIQFKWLVSNGTAWTVAQDWSASNMFTWTPTVVNANYSVGVWARSAGNTIDAAENSNAGTSMPFAIAAVPVIPVIPVIPVPPVIPDENLSVSLTASQTAPQLSGSTIAFTATGGGAATYQYKWWVFNGFTWSIAKDWSASNRFEWTPTFPNANYQILVRVMNGEGQTAGTSMPFPIAPNARKNPRWGRR